MKTVIGLPSIIEDLAPEEWIITGFLIVFAYLYYYLGAYPAITSAYERAFLIPITGSYLENQTINIKHPKTMAYGKSGTFYVNVMNSGDTYQEEIITVSAVLWSRRVDYPKLIENCPIMDITYPVNIKIKKSETEQGAEAYLNLFLPPKSSYATSFEITPLIPSIVMCDQDKDIYKDFVFYILLRIYVYQPNDEMVENDNNNTIKLSLTPDKILELRLLGEDKKQAKHPNADWVKWAYENKNNPCQSMPDPLTSSNISKDQVLCVKINSFQTLKHSLIEYLLLPPWANGFLGIYPLFLVAIISKLIIPKPPTRSATNYSQPSTGPATNNPQPPETYTLKQGWGTALLIGVSLISIWCSIEIFEIGNCLIPWIVGLLMLPFLIYLGYRMRR